MNNSKPSSKLRYPCYKRVKLLEFVIDNLEHKQMFADYVINHTRVELRLCYDTLKTVNKTSKKAMEQQKGTRETLNACLEGGIT